MTPLIGEVPFQALGAELAALLRFVWESSPWGFCDCNPLSEKREQLSLAVMGAAALRGLSRPG